MFEDCSKVTSLNLSNFNTTNVTNMAGVFKGCSNLKTIYVGENWDTTNVTSSTNMFSGCTSLVGGNGTTYDSTKIDKE